MPLKFDRDFTNKMAFCPRDHRLLTADRHTIEVFRRSVVGGQKGVKFTEVITQDALPGN